MKRFIPFVKTPPVVSVIRLQGMIAASGRAGVALNDAGVAPIIERAFRRWRPRAVALVINSPGGSPVQSSLIAARLRRLADEKGVKVHAFVEDAAASGGYWLATSADDIWVDAGSLVGSIGVISAGFGFQDFIARHGVERRLHTAGHSKSFLDPFQEEREADITRLRALLDPMHAVFIEQVKARRGARLDEHSDLFNGDIWLGRDAVDKGLADGVGHVVPKLKELYGDDVKLIPYAPRRSIFQRIAVAMAGAATGAVEEHALWARLGR
ncbi:S49 family peptidase [Rhodobacteraceae bacterium WD3A24]|nr:S49 family peptidase [Rhodobacteraceae bacterium WD3A24]